MTSTRPADDKRTARPRTSDYADKFKKDWERLSKSGRYDMKRLRTAMIHLILNEGPLPPEWKDHPLMGDWKGHRECHIGGDFLLIYRVEGNQNSETIIFVRAGTHSELF